MTTRTKAEAQEMLNALLLRTEHNRLTDDEKRELNNDISELRNFCERGIIPENQYSNVRQWLTFGQWTTLAL